MKKKVMLIEDDAPLRGQLAGILDAAPDIACIASLGTVKEALAGTGEPTPDVILLDINLPGLSGIDGLPLVRRKFPSADVLMLTAYEEDDNIFQALKAGAAGYLLKSSHTEELLHAIRDVQRGGAPFSSHIARKVVRYFQTERKPDTESEKLSQREREVLDLLAAGYLYKEVADSLDLTLETVRTYVKRICAKLQVRGRVEAIIKYKL